MNVTPKLFEKVAAAIRLYPYRPLDYGIIAHPVVTNQFTLDDKGALIVVDKTNFNSEVERMIEKLRRMDNIESLICIGINKPFRLDFLRYIDRDINRQTYSQMLIHIWTETEFPHMHRRTKDLVGMFERADAFYMMDDEDRAMFAALPQSVEVFRGCSDEKTRKRGLSWTIDTGMAWWFADRWGRRGQVYAAKISKYHIFATIASGEKEVILDPHFLHHMHRLTWRDGLFTENPS